MDVGRFTIVIPEGNFHAPFSLRFDSIRSLSPSIDQIQFFCDPGTDNVYVHNSESVNIFFFGSIYNGDFLKTILGEPLEPSSNIDLFYKLYAIYGNLAVKFLEGSFAIFIRRGCEFFLFTDPFSSVPVYTSKNLVTNSLAIYEEVVQSEVVRMKSSTVLNITTGETLKYWDLPKNIEIFDETRAIKEIQSTLRKSIKERLPQDASVGVILSGGVDSSVITALVSEVSSNVSTFCLGTKTANEFPYARSVADHFHTDHHEILLEDDEVISVIPEVIRILEIADPRFVEYLIPIILTYKYGKKYTKHFFNGYGSDILFGSYVPANVTPEENYLFVLSEYASTEDSNEYSSHISSANGIEVFYPYWDKDFIECALKIDPRLKIKNGITKYILRKAFCDLLPSLNAWRPKSGVHESTGISTIFSRFLGVEHLDFASQMAAKGKYLQKIFHEECALR